MSAPHTLAQWISALLIFGWLLGLPFVLVAAVRSMWPSTSADWYWRTFVLECAVALVTVGYFILTSPSWSGL